MIEICDSLLWYRKHWFKHWLEADLRIVSNSYVREVGRYLSTIPLEWEIKGHYEWIKPDETYRVGGLQSRGTTPFSIAAHMDEAHRLGLVKARREVYSWLVFVVPSMTQDEYMWRRIRSASGFILDEIT